MHKFYRSFLPIFAIVAAAFSFPAIAQEKPKAEPSKPKAPKNLDLEAGELGKTPTDWFFPALYMEAGYSLALSEDKPFAGKRCAVLSAKEAGTVPGFGTIIQAIDPADYRGKRIRFQAAVRAEVVDTGNQAMLWLRVDREGEVGFFDNMADRPITGREWKHYEIIGDIADDAQSIVFGMMLFGNGTAALDDVSFEIVDRATTKPTALPLRPKAAPGLTEVGMAVTINADEEAGTATFVYPLPLAYRDQVPLTFRLTVDPPAASKAVEIVEGAGENRLLKLTLQDLGKHRNVNVEYRSLVLVAPTSFDLVPMTVAFPKEWPAEAQPWLAATWCADHEDERVKKLATEIRGESNDVMAVISTTLARSKKMFAEAKGRVTHLTAIEALDKQGSCTSCANLVAALLRGAGIPARVLAGYPVRSGPLQTHYIVETWVPGYGWYPVESTMCQSSWPNHQQVNVCIVPVDHESQAKAGLRPTAAGGVPFQSLTECEGPADHFRAVGTLKPFCDHECIKVRAIIANATDWADAIQWAKPRWGVWLKSKPTLTDGCLLFGPATNDVTAKTLTQLREVIK